jgi:endoglucanase
MALMGLDQRTHGVMVGRWIRSLGLIIIVMSVLWVSMGGYVPEPPTRYAALQYPFRKARLFVDPDTAAAKWQASHGAPWLDPITRNPQARWLNGPGDLAGVPEMARKSSRRGQLLVLVTYYLPNRDCGGSQAGAPTARAYESYVEGLVTALGPVRAAIIVEPDAVVAGCFDADRAALLRRAVMRLTKAGHYVYLDAGHPRWRPVGEMTRRLQQAGIAQAEGFSVNVSNRQTTEDCYSWARRLSRRLGYRQFIIDTSRNGLGPPRGRRTHASDWCNTNPQGLGDPPTTQVRRPGLAALLWIKPPGESDGYCGGETGFDFSPDQAERLIRNAPSSGCSLFDTRLCRDRGGGPDFGVRRQPRPYLPGKPRP